METNKVMTEVTTDPWPDGLYPMSIRARDEKGQYMIGSTVTITPCPSQGLYYEDRSPINPDGVTLPKRTSQVNFLVPPGDYEVTFAKGDKTKTLPVTVKDPVSMTASQKWRDGKEFYFRDHRWDRYIIKENSYGAVNITAEDTVIDVGGHIGVFTRMSLAAGANVTVYEPDIDNYRLLQLNVREYGDKARCVRAAVVADDSDFAAAGHAALWIDADGTGDSSRSALHSLYRKRGARLPVNVPVAKWSEVLASCEPTILKVDVEGAELTYDWSMLKSCDKLRYVALEIENKGDQKENKQKIIDTLISLGFTLIKETNGWSTVHIWQR
jgi:FkbM family methyltransferase